MEARDLLLLVASSAGAGVMNALAGGGTILTYPALLALGLGPVEANATSTVALLPGAAASFFGYRREVRTHRSWLRTLALPSLVGGAAGSALLLATPDRTFGRLAPFLILFATALFLLQDWRARRRNRDQPVAPGAGSSRPEEISSAHWALAVGGQFLVAIYGGYFGAGIGILMLSILGFLGLRDIHAMNGLKNFFGFCINGVAAAWFIARGAANLPLSLVMILGAIAGGYGGARLARRIGRDAARRAVVVIGLVVAALLFLAPAGPARP